MENGTTPGWKVMGWMEILRIGIEIIFQEFLELDQVFRLIIE